MLFLVILILLIVFCEYKKNIYLIENGNIIFKNLNDNYNLESLIKDLIKQKINDINKIEKAYYLFGKLHVVFNKPHILISNGKIDYESLFKVKKSPFFIYKTLKKENLNLNQVLYAIYLNEKFYIVKL